MRRLVAVVCALALSACAIPHERGDMQVRKTAARPAEVSEVFARYAEVRSAAAELLDAKPLSTVESGPVLAIDSGSFELSLRLAQTQKPTSETVNVSDVQTPQFTKYPMWFFAVVQDKDVNRVQVFERASAADPWLLMASPQTLSDTALPELRQSGGTPVTVASNDGKGMAMSIDQAAKDYAKVLADPQAPEASRFENDSFIKQMRSAVAANAELDKVSFEQTWVADEVDYALRTADGGALAFVTLLRTDTYQVDDGHTITWPEGTPQRAFLASGIAGSGQLNYYHQVLMYLPGGSGKPRAIGQYGGVVSGDTQGFGR